MLASLNKKGREAPPVCGLDRTGSIPREIEFESLTVCGLASAGSIPREIKFESLTGEFISPANAYVLCVYMLMLASLNKK
jgi:hypothetical protein